MLNCKMPKRTVLQCGLAAVVSVLVMSWLHIRPIGIFFLAIFSFWFYKTRCNLRIVVPPELQKKVERYMENMLSLRQERPAMFCAICTGGLSVLAVLGHLISGSTVMLIALVLAAIISTKYNFKIIKLEHKDFAWTETLSHIDTEFEDEFMPEVNDSTMFVLERAGDSASITSPIDANEMGDDGDKSGDEIPAELLIPDTLPEINEHSTDEEDDLVPLDNRSSTATTATATSTSTTNSAQNAASQSKTRSGGAASMEFKKGHFKRDSSLSSTSSSSEESLSKGLKFPDHTTVDAPSKASSASAGTTAPHNQEASDIVALAVKAQTQALLANSSKLLPSLVSGIVQWSMGGGGGGGDGGSGSASVVDGAVPAVQMHERAVSALDSSDESDFEILEDEDFK